MTNKKTTTLRRSVLTGGLTLGAATAVTSTFYSNHAWSQNTMHDGGALDAAAETSENNAAISAAEAPLYNVQSVDSVAAVKTDTVLTYTAGQSGTVAAGDHIKTRKEGLTYRVAASGADDQDLTTAGGIKLYVLRDAGSYWDVTAFGAIMDSTSASVKTANKAALEVAIARGAVYIPGGVLSIDGGISISGSLCGEPGILGGSTIQCDGDMFTVASYVHCNHLRFQNITTEGKLFQISGGSAGRSTFDHCQFDKADYHIYSTLSSTVDWSFQQCRFGYATTASRYFKSIWAYTEVGCYTWYCGKGLFVENGNMVTTAIYGSVFEKNTGCAIEFASNTASGELENLHISGTHFEYNGTVTNDADIILGVTGATRIKGVSIVGCSFVTPSPSQTVRVSVSASGGGTLEHIGILYCFCGGTPVLCSDSSAITIEQTYSSATMPTAPQQVYGEKSGSFTLTDNSGAGLSMTTDLKYRRQGEFCHIQGSITFPTTADGTVISLVGLPFNAAGDSWAAVGFSSNSAAYASKTLCVNASNELQIWKSNTNKASNINFSAVTLEINHTYRVSAP